MAGNLHLAELVATASRAGASVRLAVTRPADAVDAGGALRPTAARNLNQMLDTAQKHR